MTDDSALIKKLYDAVMGNSHEGLLVRQARMEENQKVSIEAAKEAKNIAEAVRQEQTEGFIQVHVSMEDQNRAMVDLTTVVTRLAVSVEAHHATEHLSDIIKANPSLIVVVDWMKKPKFLIWFFLAGCVLFVALHMISVLVPDWLNILFKAYGIPIVLPVG